MASEEIEKVIQLIKSQPRNSGADVTKQRAAMENISEHVARDVTCTPVDVSGVRGEWIEPPGSMVDRVILYLHGGGYTAGSIRTHSAMVARIARASKARALIMNYRLAPEHPFPAALEDATLAYRWLRGENFSPTRIVIAGDSAGGGLTLATLLRLRDAREKMPAAGVAISPWTDLEGTGESHQLKIEQDPMVTSESLFGSAAMYCAGNDPKNPLISQIHADFRGLPPLLIQVGAEEILLDDSRRVAERARAAGVQVDLEVWPDMIHVWHVFAKILPEGQRAIDRIGEFVLAHTPEK